MNIDPNLHQKQGFNHLSRVLAFAPMVEEAGSATVHLTAEDWHVVADTLFHMETPREMWPEAIQDAKLHSEDQKIELATAERVIFIEMI
jgi:hypothetical protein